MAYKTTNKKFAINLNINNTITAIKRLFNFDGNLDIKPTDLNNIRYSKPEYLVYMHGYLR